VGAPRIANAVASRNVDDGQGDVALRRELAWRIVISRLTSIAYDTS